MDLHNLRIVNVRRCESVWHAVDDWSSTDWATALAGEVGEVCGAVKRLRRLYDVCESDYEDYADCVREIAEELADTILYADLLAARLGINLSEAIKKKFNKVSKEVGSEITLR